MAFRGFTRRLQRNGAWFSRLAVGGDGAAPVYPPLHIKPTAAPTTTAAKGDLYVDTNGVLQAHNGTNFVPGGGGNVVLSFLFDAGTAVDRQAFIADRAYQLVSVEEAHVTASTSGTLFVSKTTGTDGLGSGVAMISQMSLSGSANTVVSATLSATAANTKLADGDRIMLDFGGTVTNLVGCALTIVLRPI